MSLAAVEEQRGREAPGLVICAKTGREVDQHLESLQLAQQVPDYPPSIHEAWQPKFAAAGMVESAAGKFTPLPAWDGSEGPRFRIVVSPGAMAVESRDLAKAERTAERQHRQRQGEIEMIAAYMLEQGKECPDCGSDDIGWGHPAGCGRCGYEWVLTPPEHLPLREITEWSRKSRARMFRAFCELDYRPLLERSGCPAMVTLTYPGDWLTVVPDGKTAKRHLKAFRKRYERAFGHPLLALWKQEHQRRGAPHYHLFTVVPDGRTPEGKAFQEWLSQTWADIVGHPDPVEYKKHLAAGTGVDYAAGLRSSDPRRIAVYFSKHGLFGAKEYQNQVPKEWQEPGKGPGRFWGVWGLERRTAVVEVSPRDALAASRVMRRWARAQGITHVVTVKRAKGGAAQSRYPTVQGLAGAQLLAAHRTRRRKVRRRARRMYRGRGWISLNDGPAFAMEVATYLRKCHPPPVDDGYWRRRESLNKVERQRLIASLARDLSDNQGWWALLRKFGMR